MMDVLSVGVIDADNNGVRPLGRPSVRPFMVSQSVMWCGLMRRMWLFFYSSDWILWVPLTGSPSVGVSQSMLLACAMRTSAVLWCVGEFYRKFVEYLLRALLMELMGGCGLMHFPIT